MNLKYFLAASAASLPLACALVAAPAAAQQITTGIEGTVTDETGAPLAGATVTITDTRTGATRAITTGSTGSFAATGLVTGGPYEVSASADGFEGQTVSDIQTTLQGNTSLKFALASGGGTITVTAARVRATQLEVGPGTSFTTEVLTNAPTFNRDVRDIIKIDPRVSLDRDDTGSGQDRISCLGGNDRGNSFTVDRISQGDIYGLNDTGFASRSSTPVPYDAVRETQVVFAPFDVDYGQFTGCAINIVTKSGSNDFHGGGFFEYGDNGMRGDDVEGKPVAPIKPDKRWGVNLGGFIVPDRLFFFGAYEHQEAGQSQDEGPAGAGFANPITQVTEAQFNEISEVLQRVYGIDTGPLVTSRDYSNDRYFGRLDFQITDRHRLEATYQRLEENTVKVDDQAITGTFGGTVVGLNTFYNSGTKSDYYSARLYSDWTDDISTEFYYSKSKIQDIQDPVGGGEAQSDNPIPRIVVGVPNGTSPAGAVEAGPGFSRSSNDLKTDVDQFRAAMIANEGDHRIKFGFDWNHAKLFNLFVQNATGTLVFRNIEDLEAGIVTTGTSTTNSPANAVSGAAAGAFGNFSATGDINDAAAEFTRDIYAVFLQDDFPITDQLTATAGLRMEVYGGSHPEYNANFFDRYGITNSTGFSSLNPLFMPRVALNYDMDDFAVFSRPHLRGGVGVFSGGDPLVWFGNVFQNDGSTFGLGRSGAFGAAGCPTQIDVVEDGQFTGFPQCVADAGTEQSALGLGNTQSVDPDLKMPSVLRANLGFTSQLNFVDTGFFSGWDLSLDYIYSHYMNPFNMQDLSQVPNLLKGLSGFTVDGRPIYVTIDPTRDGCDARYVGNDPVPTFSGLTAANMAACITTSRFDELQLTNAGSYDSHTASIILSKNISHGLFTEGGNTFFSLGYAYSNSKDRRNMYNSTAGSNYDNTAAFDRQNPDASRSFFNSKNNISAALQLREEFFSDLGTNLGLTFNARSGRPYSLTFTGGGVFNNTNSGFENALIYLPTGIDDPNVSPLSTISEADMNTLVNFAKSLGCAKDYVGKTIARNTCSNDWYFDMDLTLSQEIPGPGRFFGLDDRIKLFATVDNFLNLLNSGWNVQHRRDFSGRQDIAQVSGVDEEGRYIFTNANNLLPTTDPTTGAVIPPAFETDEFINMSSSVWRLKIGVSYQF